MQFLLSGPLAGRASSPDARQDNDDVEDAWVCCVCGAKNTDADLEDGTETDRCKRCARLRHPQWLLVEKANLQLELGSCVRLLDDVNFGTKVAVVSGLDFYKRRIQVFSVCSKVQYQSSSSEKSQDRPRSSNDRRSKFVFELSELEQADIQQLQLIANDDEAANSLLSVFKQHGLCGDCRRVFRVTQGDIKAEEAGREEIRAVERELHRWNKLKMQYVKLRENERVLECTDRIKSLTLQLSKVRRSVEFLKPLTCPHCGWNAP